ncbi:MAG TPA: hypothetical protein VNQ79_13680 [Blastocatellia bacterium]|nr:hypothetical protein [Blastocatellia bacterium]
MTRHACDRTLFSAAALFNLASAALLLFFPRIFLARLGITDPAAVLLARSLASSATTWGIGYALVAVNAKRYRPFALLGAISKTIFALIYTTALLRGLISFTAFIPALIELVFAALFIEFLWRSRER